MLRDDRVWPGDIEFRYSQMLFVGSDGTVWIAKHIEPLVELETLNRHRVWIDAGGDPFMIRSDGGFEWRIRVERAIDGIG